MVYKVSLLTGKVFDGSTGTTKEGSQLASVPLKKLKSNNPLCINI